MGSENRFLEKQASTEFQIFIPSFFLSQIYDSRFKDNTPALTFRIAEDYFVNNLSDEEGNFALADGFYSRTIQQDDLTLAFDTSDDGELQKLLFAPK